MESSLRFLGHPCGACLGLESGRTMARIGLRMMPPFPSSPLSFRTAGFPQSGWKAGLSDGALPVVRERCRDVRFASAFRAPRCLYRYAPVLNPGTRCAGAPPCKRPLPLYPRGPRSSRVMLSRPSSLIDPMRPTRQLISISPTRLIRDVFAVRPIARLGNQRVVPCFRGPLFVGMSSSGTPGTCRLHVPSSFADNAGLRHGVTVSAFPTPPPSDSRRGTLFRGFTTIRFRYDLPTCSPPLSELTGVPPQPTEAFTSGLPAA